LHRIDKVQLQLGKRFVRFHRTLPRCLCR
jgi:hypothetical protein